MSVQVTTMKVQRETLDLLKERGVFGESYEDIVKRLLVQTKEPLEKNGFNDEG